MSRGFLMFAHDSGSLSYGRMALANATLIKSNCLNPTVALVTDHATISSLQESYGDLVGRFDHIIIDEVNKVVPLRRFSDTRSSSEEVPYLNSNRSSAMDLSPFDETVLLDVDYLMLDGTMDLVWGSVEDLMCNSLLMDLDHNTGVERMHDMGIPTYWATAMYFRKTNRTKALFDHMSYIRDNYDYYMDLYGFNHGPYFRNDFALSISLHEMNGFVEEDAVCPLPIDHIFIGDPFDDIHGFDGSSFLITSERTQGSPLPHRVSRNFHVMNKKALLRHCDEVIHAKAT